MNAVGCELSAVVRRLATSEGQPPQTGEGVTCRQLDVSWGSLLDSAVQKKKRLVLYILCLPALFNKEPYHPPLFFCQSAPLIVFCVS